MKKNQFTNFDYEIITSSSTGKKEVKVSYQFNNKQCRKYLLVDESKKLNDGEYIEIAKEQIEESIKNGQLAKYSKQFTFSVHFGVIPTVIASIAGVAAITCASLFAWKAITGGGGTGGGGGGETGETEIVEFLNEDGTLFKREKVTKGDKVTKPETDPSTDDGCFANWYTEPTFKHIYDFNEGVESDLKLYPKFAKRLLDITYKIDAAKSASVTPFIKLNIDAQEGEEIFISWENGSDPELYTNFGSIEHEYGSEANEVLTTIYGQPDAVSLSTVDGTDPTITHLIDDANRFAYRVDLYHDMGDTNKSSCMGGLTSDETGRAGELAFIHNGVTYIPNHFLASSNFGLSWMLIEKGVFADTVTTIGEYAYANTKLSQALIKDGVKYIKKGAFQKCADLTYVRTGRYLKSIGDNVFDDCSSTLNFYVDNLWYEWHVTEECPTFGARNYSKFNNFYFFSKDSGDEFMSVLTNANWPISDPGTHKKCVVVMGTTDLSCKHSYKLSNTRYPLMETRSGPTYIYSNPISNRWYSEIICTDDPSVEISSSTLACLVDEGGFVPHFDSTILGSEPTYIYLDNSELSNPRDWEYPFFNINIREI